MKLAVLLITFCSTLLTPFLAHSTWVRQNSGTALPLNGVFFVDSLYGWAVGGNNNNGIILKTTNGGQTWNTAYTDTQAIFESIWFISRQTGWVVGGRDNLVVIDSTCQKILMTTDGGLSWQRQWNRNPNTNWLPLYGVCFIGNTGWATVTGWADSVGHIIHTTNGGATWINQTINDPAACPWDIHFVTTSRGVCSGGINWAYPYDNTDGHIWWTSDGGTNWSDGHNWRPGNVAMGFLTSVWMVDALHGWSVGGAGGMSVREPGRVVKTINGGSSWTTCNPTPLRPYWGVYFPDTLWGWVGDYYTGLLLTTNGGSTWQDDNAGATSILDIHGINRRNAWAVGANGTIIKYSPMSEIESENLLSFESIKLRITPNPFRTKAVIQYALNTRHYAQNTNEVLSVYSLVPSLRIYDATGRLVKQFNHLTIKPSNYIIWDGRDEKGQQLPNGSYILEIKSGNKRLTETLIYVR